MRLSQDISLENELSGNEKKKNSTNVFPLNDCKLHYGLFTQL